MKLDFPVVIEALIKAKGSGFSQHLIIDGIYRFIGEQDPTYYVEPISEAYASNVKKRKENVRKKIVEGSYVPRIISSMPRHVQNEILPILKVEKCRALVDSLLSVIRSDSQIGLTARERMEMAAADPAKLHVFLAEVIIYALQQSNADLKDVEQAEPIADVAPKGKIVSFVVPPVSKENYVSRPDIERDISQSLHTNKITVIRGMSGLGKSELARKVATDESDFSTIIRLELGNDGSGDFEKLLDSQVSIIEISKNKDPLECKKDLLRTAGLDCLVIVDNLNDISNSALLLSLANSTGNARILFTSQVQEEKLNELYQNFRIQMSVIDLETDKYSQKEFAPMVFCSYAGLVYAGLTIDEQSAVQTICDHVVGHTMIVAALGLRMKKYGDYARKLLITMVEDVDNCMSNIRVKLQKDMAVTRSLTAYEILKGLSASLLQRNYTERERQVLGAAIILPHEYKNRDVLSELVGDLIEADYFEATDAIEKLCDDGVLRISAAGDIILHPLYSQLFSDSTIKFYNDAGLEQKGPIAELSFDFRFHLLNNSFVSCGILKWNNYLRNYRKLGTYMGLLDSRKYKLTSIRNAGWLVIFAETYGDLEINYIQSAIVSNHQDINCSTAINIDELSDILVDTSFQKFNDVVSDDELSDILDAISNEWTELEDWLDSHQEVDILDDERLEGSDYEPWSEPVHPSLFFITEGTNGRSMWLLDYVTKKQLCIINLSEQRQPHYRYFIQYPISKRQNGKMTSARLIDFFGGWMPKNLLVPTTIAGVDVCAIHQGCSRNFSSDTPGIICIPSVVTYIDENAFFGSDGPSERIIILGERICIGDGAFDGMLDTQTSSVFLPDKSLEIRHRGFGVYGHLKHVVVPFGAQLEICYPDMHVIRISEEFSGNLYIPITAQDGSKLYYSTIDVIDALFQEWETEIYDVTHSVPLDWQVLFAMMSDAPYETLKMKIGVDFIVADNINIVYSPEILNQYPLIKYSIKHYISSFPKGCRVLVNKNTSCDANALGSKEAESVYISDLIDMLQYCIDQAKKSVDNNDIDNASNLLEIAASIIHTKQHLLPPSIDTQMKRYISQLQDLL